MDLQTAGSSHNALLSIARKFQRVALPAFIAAALTCAQAEDAPPPLSAAAAPIDLKDRSAVEKFRSDFTPLPVRWDSLHPTVATSLLREIEQRANATNPAFPVVILDDDSINLRPTKNEPSFRNRLYEILNDRHIQLRWYSKSDTFLNFGRLKGPSQRNAIATKINTETYAGSNNPVDEGVVQSKVCLVVPEVADLSSRSLLEKWLGKAGQNYQQARIDSSNYAMMLRSVWHEVWHCLDDEFYFDPANRDADIPSAFIKMNKLHYSEVFAEVAAVLTMAGMGYPHMARDMADIRSVSAHWNGPRDMRGVHPKDDEYYNGSVYTLTRALDMAARHIEEAGVESVSRYAMDDIRRIAREVTIKGALNKDEFKLVSEYYARGESLINALRAANGANTEKASFLAGVRDRAIAARQRILINTGRPVDHAMKKEDEEHYSIDDILNDMPPEEKADIARIVKERADTATAAGKIREQGVLDLIEEWRQQIHISVERKSDIERRLYVLSLMLSYGHLDVELGRPAPRRLKASEITADKEPDPEKAKADEIKPDFKADPELLNLPDFTPKEPWEPLPPENNQARIKYTFSFG